MLCSHCYCSMSRSNIPLTLVIFCYTTVALQITGINSIRKEFLFPFPGNMQLNSTEKQNRDNKIYSMRIYVGNLNDKIEDDHLKKAFQDYGTVTSAKIIIDKYTGRSRGFGFIEMPNIDEALKVIETVNGGTWEGKVIKVNKAINKV